ncbi:hypothetical protein TcasGA2_TC012733 [Tribolium castaneum]|uniref:Uncharacterized protein n=1 Tax=Tribolium castaneum TaxID=7070 RepID=D6WZW2_TRICA|nr:hypothetical protein TcasGA2_TC012733 [Tribolium castaneum]
MAQASSRTGLLIGNDFGLGTSASSYSTSTSSPIIRIRLLETKRICVAEWRRVHVPPKCVKCEKSAKFLQSKDEVW